MPFHVVVIDLVPGTCQLTGKEGAECLKVRLRSRTPVIVCQVDEFVKLLRLFKKQPDGKGTRQKKKGVPPRQKRQLVM